MKIAWVRNPFCAFEICDVVSIPSFHKSLMIWIKLNERVEIVEALWKYEESFRVSRANGPHDHVDQLCDQLVNGRAVFDEPFVIDAKNIDDELLN